MAATATMPVIRIDTITIEFMFLHLIRCPDVFNAARVRVEPDLFSKADETKYLVAWKIALEYFESYGDMVPHQYLSVNTASAIDASPACPQEALDDAVSFVDWLFSETENPTADLRTDVGMDLLQRFLLDRQVHQPIIEAAALIQAGGTVDLNAVVEESNIKKAAVESLGTRVPMSAVPTPEQWDSIARERYATGVKIIDDRMDGGSENGDVNLLFGPTGVGKTLLGVQMLTSCAKVQRNSVAEGGEGRTCVYISYEAPMHEVQVRMLAYGARVDKGRLERIKNYNELSTTGNLQEYETRLFARENGEEQLGEQERIALCRPWMNQHIKIFDFSGARVDGQPPHGHGGMAEIRQVLTATQAQCGPLALVVIDWIGMMVRRYINATSKDMAAVYHHMLNEWCDVAHTELAVPFNCPVWGLHQMSGQANKRSPTAELHHSDAEGCASMAVNSWFAFCLGNKDSASNTCLLAATKTRRGEGKETEICYINGAFGEMRSAAHEYTRDPVTKQLRPIAENSHLHDMRGSQKPQLLSNLDNSSADDLTI
jgi:RecA/RadA recombinase